MFCGNKLYISVVFAVVSVALGYIMYDLHGAPSMPEIDHNKWWGDGMTSKHEDDAIRPFEIVFNDTMIEDLKRRLRHRRAFTRPMDKIQSEYGINTEYLNKVLNYWHDEYNFKERAQRLNKLPHFKTKIQGLDIHFIRAKPEATNKKVLPILLMHGWPSSSKEFDIIIPLMMTPTQEYDFVFEIIAVDLPGFGYSEGTNKPGLNAMEMSIIMRNLMKRLGIDKYYIHAGDWGAQVATHMTTIYQDEILGFHTNFALSLRRLSFVKYFIGSLLFPSLLVDENSMDRITLSIEFKNILLESGYYHLQVTKPDTIGAALTDSPAGMAAYLLEKIGVCSNLHQTNTPHGGMENIQRDDLLDTVTIMWATEHIATSIRLYAESLSLTWREQHILQQIPTQVPTAAVKFRHEVLFQPDWIIRDKFQNLLRSTVYDYGGHFAALHTPRELVDDIFASVAEFIHFNGKK